MKHNMESLIYSLNATVPIFMLILIGWFLCNKTKILSDRFADEVNDLAFKILFPVLLFRDIASSSIEEAFSLPFFLFCFLGTVVYFAAAWLASIIFIKNRGSRAGFFISACRSSAAVLGIAFAENIYGSSVYTPLMIVASVPLFNIFSVIAFTVYSEDGGKISPVKILGGIIKNPLIIGIICGIPFSLLHITIPSILAKCINMLSVLATPLALIMVGAGFKSDAAIEKMGMTVWASVIKLIILPAVFIPAAILFGFRGEALIAVLIMTGSPTTVAAYIMAKSMKQDHALVSGVVVLSTVFSAFTITLSIFLLKSAGLV